MKSTTYQGVKRFIGWLRGVAPLAHAPLYAQYKPEAPASEYVAVDSLARASGLYFVVLTLLHKTRAEENSIFEPNAGTPSDSAQLAQKSNRFVANDLEDRLAMSSTTFAQQKAGDDWRLIKRLRLFFHGGDSADSIAAFGVRFALDGSSRWETFPARLHRRAGAITMAVDCCSAVHGSSRGFHSAMLAKLKTFSLLGIDALPVEVEVDVSPRALPKTILVGLPEAAVKESTHRVERAIVNSGFTRPQDRIVINLAPAELPKQAASFDLPISLGILAGSGQITSDRWEQYAVVGELSLEGGTRPVKGALSMAIAAKQQGLRGLIVPSGSSAEAAVVEEIEVIAVDSLAQTVGFYTGQLQIEPTPSRLNQLFEEYSNYEDDFADVRGQEMAKRAITIAAAGSHNLLMLGPPGSGKTMLAKRTPTIMPTLSAEESIETTRIYSALGRLEAGQPLLARRPFRSPHHTISNAGLVGGGSTPTPGEISLAHNGVLFLDELPEFNRQTLEVLRQPLEDKTVTISRALASTTFPTDFMLIAALNPCPCGYRNDPRRDCHCSVPQIERYMSKISGPLLDRIDIHIEVPAVDFKELSSERSGTSSKEMRQQALSAREIQDVRFRDVATRRNAQMSSRLLRKYCPLGDECKSLLKASVNEMGLSARAHDKILRVSRTIADLAMSENIQADHINEAINYRMLDRQLWT